jgi:hypothetical protein
MCYIALANNTEYSLVEVISEPRSFSKLFVGEESFTPGLYEVVRSGTLDDHRTIYPLYFTRLIRACTSDEVPLRSIPLALKGEPAHL